MWLFPILNHLIFSYKSRFLLNTLSREELYLQKAENVEYKLVTKYNEIFIPNDDEYEGYQSVENKRHGFIFSYNEV